MYIYAYIYIYMTAIHSNIYNLMRDAPDPRDLMISFDESIISQPPYRIRNCPPVKSLDKERGQPTILVIKK
jgi:hypothetical protein